MTKILDIHTIHVNDSELRDVEIFDNSVIIKTFHRENIRTEDDDFEEANTLAPIALCFEGVRRINFYIEENKKIETVNSEERWTNAQKQYMTMMRKKFGNEVKLPDIQVESKRQQVELEDFLEFVKNEQNENKILTGIWYIKIDNEIFTLECHTGAMIKIKFSKLHIEQESNFSL